MEKLACHTINDPRYRIASSSWGDDVNLLAFPPLLVRAHTVVAQRKDERVALLDVSGDVCEVASVPTLDAARRELVALGVV